MRIAREPVDRYFSSLVDSASDWSSGESSDDYKNYDKIIAQLEKENLDTQMEKSSAWVGNPADLVEMIREYDREVGGIDDASLQVNFTSVPFDAAAASIRLFSEKVMPHFK